MRGAKMAEMEGGAAAAAAAAAAVSEGLPHWSVPTSFPHITNFVSVVALLNCSSHY